MNRNTEIMIDYLEHAIEIEKSIYVLEEIEKKLQGEMSRLGRASFFPEPVEDDVSLKECFEGSGGLGVILGMIIGGILGYLGTSGFISTVIYVVVKGIYGALIGGIIGLLVTPLWYLIAYICAQIRLSSATKERARRVENDQRRVRYELAQMQQLKFLFTAVNRKKIDSEVFRTSFYSYGPIYKDYQNFAAVCSFHQYFCSGKCTMLQGHEGAYVLYDYERRMDLILDKLTDIQRNLEQIQRNQYMLYTAIVEGNRKIDTLIAQSAEQTRLLQGNLEQNAIIAHNTELARKEIAFSNWLKTYTMSRRGY